MYIYTANIVGTEVLSFVAELFGGDFTESRLSLIETTQKIIISFLNQFHGSVEDINIRRIGTHLVWIR